MRSSIYRRIFVSSRFHANLIVTILLSSIYCSIYFQTNFQLCKYSLYVYCNSVVNALYRHVIMAAKTDLLAPRGYCLWHWRRLWKYLYDVIYINWYACMRCDHLNREETYVEIGKAKNEVMYTAIWQLLDQFQSVLVSEFRNTNLGIISVQFLRNERVIYFYLSYSFIAYLLGSNNQQETSLSCHYFFFLLFFNLNFRILHFSQFKRMYIYFKNNWTVPQI